MDKTLKDKLDSIIGLTAFLLHDLYKLKKQGNEKAEECWNELVALDDKNIDLSPETAAFITLKAAALNENGGVPVTLDEIRKYENAKNPVGWYPTMGYDEAGNFFYLEDGAYRPSDGEVPLCLLCHTKAGAEHFGKAYQDFWEILKSSDKPQKNG